MKENKLNLSYMKFRRIVMILAKNEKLRGLLDGKAEIALDFAGFLEILEETEIDAEVVEVITGRKIDDLDAMEGIEALRDFFEYIGSNSVRLSDCLSSLGSVAKVEKEAARAISTG